jgi:hypothetical protein
MTKLLVPILTALALGLTGCGEDRPAEKVGGQIDDAVEDVQQAGEDAADAVGEAAEEVGEAAEEAGEKARKAVE